MAQELRLRFHGGFLLQPQNPDDLQQTARDGKSLF